ncbi:hypothetical protein [Streptomyces albicerus]|uniref:hypothetical protein n=1 Tax=Streptomyces albicerus TaxID=2569859 RepID=UPI00124B1140|nr:hypothetical protein [Streptomyces albicerus]
MVKRRRYAGAALAVLLTALTTLAAAPAGATPAAAPAGARGDGRPPPAVHPGLKRHLAAHYDFEHPVPGNPARERDRGFSGTDIDLVNGGARMRTADGAHRGSRASLQVKQVGQETAGNDDWKAGVYSASGVPTLNAFNAVRRPWGLSGPGAHRTSATDPRSIKVDSYFPLNTRETNRSWAVDGSEPAHRHAPNGLGRTGRPLSQPSGDTDPVRGPAPGGRSP